MTDAVRAFLPAAAAAAAVLAAAPAAAIPVATPPVVFGAPSDLRIPGTEQRVLSLPERLRTPGLRTDVVPLADPLIERGRAEAAILIRRLVGRAAHDGFTAAPRKR